MLSPGWCSCFLGDLQTYPIPQTRSGLQGPQHMLWMLRQHVFWFPGPKHVLAESCPEHVLWHPAQKTLAPKASKTQRCRPGPKTRSRSNGQNTCFCPRPQTRSRRICPKQCVVAPGPEHVGANRTQNTAFSPRAPNTLLPSHPQHMLLPPRPRTW